MRWARYSAGTEISAFWGHLRRRRVEKQDRAEEHAENRDRKVDAILRLRPATDYVPLVAEEKKWTT